TCNKIAALPPELRRRFTFGTFFFDTPSAIERRQIWEIYLRKFDISGPLPDSDEGWTGAEIRQCADLCYRLKCSPAEAAAYIVPVSKPDPEGTERLRQMANGKFISAAYAGLSRHHQTPPPIEPAPAIRRIDLSEGSVN